MYKVVPVFVFFENKEFRSNVNSTGTLFNTLFYTHISRAFHGYFRSIHAFLYKGDSGKRA